MSDFATIEDVTILWRPLTPEEQERVAALLPVVSDMLRNEAYKRDADLDRMIEERGGYYANVVKAVTVDVIARIIRQSTTGELMSQESQGALGYTWSGTYAIPGGGMSGSIMRNDLKRLGLLTQKGRVVEMYDKWDDCIPAE